MLLVSVTEKLRVRWVWRAFMDDARTACICDSCVFVVSGRPKAWCAGCVLPVGAVTC